VQEARGNLSKADVDRVKDEMSRSEVEQWRDFYDNAVQRGRGGDVAPERAGLMRDILKRW
jgi:hypothetical protein